MTGRPPLYDDPVLMEAKIDQYFDECELKDKTPTVPGLCLFLGFSSRQSFLDYEKREIINDEGKKETPFSCTIKKARLKIEADRADKLLDKNIPTAGVIFDLTNNHGWKNPQHLKHSGDEEGAPIQTVTKIELVEGGK